MASFQSIFGFQPWQQRGRTPPFFPGNPAQTQGAAPPQQQQPLGAGVAARFPGPAWLQKIQGGFDKFMGGMAGPVDPNLTAQEQDAAKQQQRMAMVSALLQGASPVPQGTSSPLAAFGTAMQAGQQAGQEATANALRMRMMQAQLQPKAPDETWAPVSAEEKAALGIPPESFAQRGSISGQIKIDDRPQPPASTTVSVNTGKSFYEDLGAQQAKQYSELYGSATSAPDMLARSARVRELLDTVPYTGTGAEYQVAVGKAMRALGFNYAEDDLTNTETLMVELSRGALDAIKASGLAGSQGLTEGERKFLERAVSGQITMEPESLRELSRINEKAARRTAKKWNDTYNRLDAEQMRTLGMAPIELPAEADDGWGIVR